MLKKFILISSRALAIGLLFIAPYTIAVFPFTVHIVIITIWLLLGTTLFVFDDLLGEMDTLTNLIKTIKTNRFFKKEIFLSILSTNMLWTIPVLTFVSLIGFLNTKFNIIYVVIPLIIGGIGYQISKYLETKLSNQILRSLMSDLNFFFELESAKLKYSRYVYKWERVDFKENNEICNAIKIKFSAPKIIRERNFSQHYIVMDKSSGLWKIDV